MKTKWSVDYLNSKMSGKEIAEWRSRKRAELAEKTGVPWSDCHAHGKIVFLPYLDYKNTIGCFDNEMVATFITAWEKTKSPLGYTSFLSIQRESQLSFSAVMEIARGLLETGRAIPTVNRMGKLTYIKISGGEK